MIGKLGLASAAFAVIASAVAGAASADDGYHWFSSESECQASRTAAVNAGMAVFTGCEQYDPSQHRYPLPGGTPGHWWYAAR